MRCRRCREPAVVEVRRHNAAFCGPCFVHHCRQQVARTLGDLEMVGPGEKVLLAVSGGKDSLALWDILTHLEIPTDGLYLGLGIGDYSARSGEQARRFSAERGLTLHEIDLGQTYGIDVPGAAVATRRAPCSACGLSKRHLFNQVALERGYDVVATGHNLDDEAAVLFGNVLRWNTEYLGRQVPVLPARPGFARKVKPLVRLGERETAAYCVVRGIDYIVEECPNAEGNRHLGYKQALDAVEVQSPGTKQAFYFGFLERASAHFAPEAREEQESLTPCTACGAPTSGGVCAFCRLLDRAGAERPRP